MLDMASKNHRLKVYEHMQIVYGQFMQDVYHLISSKIRVEILKVLAVNPESSFNINELSRLTGFSLRGVDRELKNLLSGGLLRREISGNQHRYQLDPACPIRKEVSGIIAKTVGISDALKRGLAQVRDEIHLAFIYGSFASGDYGNESDVDLFIVGDISGVKLSELLGPLQEQLGRPINTSLFSLLEYDQRKDRGDHFLNRVLEGPKIVLFGSLNES
jgi:predicted nucleotidyltransferase